MSSLKAKFIALSAHRFYSIGPHICFPRPHRYFASSPSFSHPKQDCNERKSTSSKSAKQLRGGLNEKHYPDIMWWKEKMQILMKNMSLQSVKGLSYSNLLGVDEKLKNGSLKEGTRNYDLLKLKSRFPREVLLSRAGNYYQAIGFDACIVEEYACRYHLNAQHSDDSIPEVSCLAKDLDSILNDLTRNGFSVCIVEEFQDPTQSHSCKSRFISGHVHPRSFHSGGYAERHALDDRDLEFPDPMAVVGVSYSTKGYCIFQVLESMKTFTSEEGLTEEAIFTKLRTCNYHHLFLHNCLKNNPSGAFDWKEFGKGGRPGTTRCNDKNVKWLEGNMAEEILIQVKELYGLDEKVTFRNMSIPLENRPHPLNLKTALQIGAVPNEGGHFLVDSLLPSDCTGPPAMYVNNLLLNPPPYATAHIIQEIGKLMSNVSCTIPRLTGISPSKLVKLLDLKEVNHVEFLKVKSVVDQILKMYSNLELNEILRSLMDPTSLATGLNMNLETIVNECEIVSSRIGSYLRYHEAGANAKTVVLKLRQLCADLQQKTDILIYASMLLIIAKSLLSHVSEGKRKGWAFPTLVQSYNSEEKGQKHGLKITGIVPHWFDPAKYSAVKNTVDLQSMFLLTGPETGGKSSLILSVGATALFGLCGFMVPAESAIIPEFDFILLHMQSSIPNDHNIPEIELSELCAVLTRATSKSLVLVDGLWTYLHQKVGTRFAGDFLKHLDSIGCVAIVSTDLGDDILNKLGLIFNNTDFKAMGVVYVNGKKTASYKLIDGISTVSLWHEIYESLGIAKILVERARELYRLESTSHEA